MAVEVPMYGEVPAKVGDVTLREALIVINAGNSKATEDFNDGRIILRCEE
jgi:hypothetical protein